MVELAGSYDEQAELPADFGPIPSGEYEAEIIESSVEDISSKEDKGKCLLLVWKILSGDYQGRQIWQRINLWFSGAEKTPGKVVQIANGEFGLVREATGVKMPGDSSELHNRPCSIRVAFINDAGYAPKNEVKYVKAVGTHQPFKAPAAPGPRSAPSNEPASGGGAPRSAPGSAPWRKAG